MPATLQREFRPVLSEVKAPTLPLSSFAAHLGEAESWIRDCCELDHAVMGAERIDWAWNIASRGAKRADIRIPSFYLPIANRAVVLSLDDIAALIFRGCQHISAAVRTEHRQVSGVQFQRALDCGPDHVRDLIADGDLTLYTARDQASGPGSSPQIQWASVRHFLTTRKL